MADVTAPTAGAAGTAGTESSTLANLIKAYRKLRWLMRFFSPTAFRRYRRSIQKKIYNVRNRKALAAAAETRRLQREIIDQMRAGVHVEQNEEVDASGLPELKGVLTPVADVQNMLDTFSESITSIGSEMQIRNSGGPMHLEYVYGFPFRQPRGCFPIENDHLAFVTGSTCAAFNPTTGRQSYLLDHSSQVLAMCTDPTFQYVASVDASHIIVWRYSSSMRVISRFPSIHGGATTMAFNRQSDGLLVCGKETITLFNWRTGEVITTTNIRNVEDELILGVQFDSYQLTPNFTTFGYKTCQVWRIRDRVPLTGMQIRRQRPGGGAPLVLSQHIYTAVAFVNKGEFLCGTQDGRLFSVLESMMSDTIGNAHNGAIFCMASMQGTVATSGADGVINFWDSKLNCLKSMDLFDNASVLTLSYTQSEQMIVSTNHGDVYTIDPATGDGELLLHAHDGAKITAVGIRPLGRQLVTTDSQGYFRLWDHHNHSLLDVLETDTRPTCVKFMPNGNRVVAGTDGDGILIIQLHSVNPMYIRDTLSFDDPEDASNPLTITCVSLSKDGVYIAAGTSNGYIALFRELKLDPTNPHQQHECVFVTGPHTGAVTAIDLSNDVTFIRSQCSDKALKYWSITGGTLKDDKCAKQMAAGTGAESEQAAERSPTEYLGSLDRWQSSFCSEANIYLSRLTQSRAFILSMDKQASFVISCGGDGLIRSYRLPLETARHNEPIALHDAQTRSVQCMAFCPKSQMLFYIGVDGTSLLQWKVTLAQSTYATLFRECIRKIIRMHRVTSLFRGHAMSMAEQRQEELKAKGPVKVSNVRAKAGWAGAAQRINIGRQFEKRADPIRKSKIRQGWKVLTRDGLFPAVQPKDSLKFAMVIFDNISEGENIAEVLKALKPVLDNDWIKGMDECLAKVPTWKLVKQTNDFMREYGAQSGQEAHSHANVAELLSELQVMVDESGTTTNWETGSFLESITGEENELQLQDNKNVFNGKQWRYNVDRLLGKERLAATRGSETFDGIASYLEVFQSKLVGTGKITDRMKTFDAAFRLMDMDGRGEVTYEALVSFNEMMVGSHAGSIDLRLSAFTMLENAGVEKITTEAKIKDAKWQNIWSPSVSSMSEEEFAVSVPSIHKILKVC